jgi:hypothetical protein
MPADRETGPLLGADAETLAILADGIRVRGPHHFGALEVEERRWLGVRAAS